MTTGLHCGPMDWTVKNLLRPLFPVMTTGLHCGKDAFDTVKTEAKLFPVMTTGLHCGEASILEANYGGSSSRS